uniref:Serine/arginine repetitive matrix protein 1 n=1 Tax=Echeneis naucrates TaxID=173247 RepID=A0A665TYT1_ECHNA
MDAGFFRGTSAEQDNRFSNKHKKLLKQLKFAECLDKKVDMTKVNLEVIKPWITQRVTEILGFEDDVVIEFIFNQLEEKHPDSKMMQINLTGFLNGKNAREFMKDLWPLLLSAQENIAGIPSAFLEQKKEEIKQRQIEQEKLASLKKVDDDKKEKDKETRERAQSKSPRRRKTRSPSPRRRSPVKRERKCSPSRSPKRKPSPAGGNSPPPPLMQLPTKPLEQLIEPDTSGRAMPEPVVQEASSTCDAVVEVVKADSVTEVKEPSIEKIHKKEERPRSREREKDSRRERPHHRSHSRSRRRRSRSRSYSPRRRQSPRRRMSPRRRSPPRRGPTSSRHRHRRSPVRRRRSRSASSSGSSSSGSRSPKKAMKRISSTPPRKQAHHLDTSISPGGKDRCSPSPRARRGRSSASPPRSSGLKRKPGGRSDSPSNNAKPRHSEASDSAHTVEVRIRQLLMPPFSVVSDTGSSSSEEEGPKRPTAGPGARNGEVRRRRSRTPSPRRRHRDISPRKRRSPSPGRRRRSPSPPRRSPSPPPRRRSPSPRRYSPPIQRRYSPSPLPPQKRKMSSSPAKRSSPGAKRRPSRSPKRRSSPVQRRRTPPSCSTPPRHRRSPMMSSNWQSRDGHQHFITCCTKLSHLLCCFKVFFSHKTKFYCFYCFILFIYFFYQSGIPQ